MTKEEFLKRFNKRGKIEKVSLLFFACVVLPWMIGLAIATIMMEPLVANFVMIFKFMLWSVAIALPIGVTGCLLEFLRESKEEYDEDRRRAREFDRLIEGRIRGRDSSSPTSDD